MNSSPHPMQVAMPVIGIAPLANVPEEEVGCPAISDTLSTTLGGAVACGCITVDTGGTPQDQDATFTGINGTFSQTKTADFVWESSEIGVITVDKYVGNSGCAEAGYQGTDTYSVKLVISCDAGDLTLAVYGALNSSGVYDQLLGSANPVLDEAGVLTISHLCGGGFGSDITYLVEEA